MKCEEVKINLPEYIDGRLDEKIHEDIHNHLGDCESCRQLHAELSSFLTYVDSFPEPEVPFGMKEEFAELVSKMDIPQQQKTLVISMWMKIAAVIVLSLGTYWTGYRVGSVKSENANSQLASELHQQKQEVSLASLRDYTGPQKIEAVYTISKTDNVSEELISALVYTMNSDKNVNVRLAAISALSGMMEKNDRVKKEMIKSLAVQENSLLQISLIQVLTEMKVKEAKDQIESITKDAKTDESVKAFAKDMIKIII